MKSAKGSKQCAVPQHSKLMFQLKDLLIFRPNYSLGDKDVPEISQEHSVSVGVGLSSWAKHDGYSSGQSASTLQQARQLLLASDQSFPQRDFGSDGPDDPAHSTCVEGWIGGAKRYPA